MDILVVGSFLALALCGLALAIERHGRQRRLRGRRVAVDGDEP